VLLDFFTRSKILLRLSTTHMHTDSGILNSKFGSHHKDELSTWRVYFLSLFKGDCQSTSLYYESQQREGAIYLREAFSSTKGASFTVMYLLSVQD